MAENVFTAEDGLGKIGSLVDTRKERLCDVYFEFSLTHRDTITIRTFSEKKGFNHDEINEGYLSNSELDTILADQASDCEPVKNGDYHKFLSNLGAELDRQKAHPLVIIYSSDKTHVEAFKPKEDFGNNQLEGAIIENYIFDQEGKLI